MSRRYLVDIETVTTRTFEVETEDPIDAEILALELLAEEYPEDEAHQVISVWESKDE